MSKEPLIKYISPTSYNLFWSDRLAWYNQYVKGIRAPQTKHMVMGLIFDSVIKSKICDIFSIESYSNEQEFQSVYDDIPILELKIMGEELAGRYIESGGFRDLIEVLKEASNIKMEYMLETTIAGVPVLGKPDLSFEVDGKRVVLDWKVRGYFSKVSPTAGYVKDYSNGKKHKDCDLILLTNKIMGSMTPIPNTGWLTQLTMYGADIGWVDEICGRDGRLTTHRFKIPESFRQELEKGLCDMWNMCQNNDVLGEIGLDERVVELYEL